MKCPNGTKNSLNNCGTSMNVQLHKILSGVSLGLLEVDRQCFIQQL
jgi:hypothetical protein